MVDNARRSFLIYIKEYLWQDIKSYCQDIPGAFPYPIIADDDRSLAVKLDMIDEESKDDPEQAITVRALYIISPDHRLRLSMHYPTSTGRNVEWVSFSATLRNVIYKKEKIL